MPASSRNRPSPATIAAAPRQRKSAKTPSPSVWGDAVPGAEQSAALKRRSILRQAGRAFNRAGFHGTSMDDIAASLGVTKPALYRYVRSKHEVLFESFNLGLDSGFAHLDRAQREGRNGLDKLRIALTGYLEEMIGELGHPAILLEDNALLPEHARVIVRRRDQAEARFRALVSEGIADRSVVPCDPKLAVFAMLGAVSWVPKWYRDDGEWTPADVARSLVDIMVRGIARRPDAIDLERIERRR